MPGTARVGDPISHGGTIITGSISRLQGGVGVARQGDLVACAIHGVQTIITGSTDVILDGVGVARVGDVVSCGATITSGALDSFSDS